MSDLISRKKLIESIKKFDFGSFFSATEKEYIESTMIALVNLQQTAYSIDEVVNELEEVKMRYFLTIANTGDEKSDFAYDNVGNALDKAIEIVKQGVVTDDVCEWKSDCHLENDNPAEWLISPHKPKKIFSTDIKHCPYCGKKIKVVE